MSNQYDNTNTGVLFMEPVPKKGPKYPDMTGRLDVNGVEYRIVGWKRKTKDGNPMLSLSIELPREKRQGGPVTAKPQQAQADEPFNDSLPW